METKTFFVKAGFTSGVCSFLQDGTTKEHAIATVNSTGAKVISIEGPLSEAEILKHKSHSNHF